ncbi:hypothetical protein RJT34_09276 [Clitoria ternatea]|uniref:C2 domain-containing protein n=1 Tax=Clitoria ternatea TaxID=43366 RepID=A0AAN9K818_CLITE
MGNGINGVTYEKWFASRTKGNVEEKTRRLSDDEIVLHVMIMSAMGIDHPTLHPNVVSRYYNVVYWVEPGDELRTCVKEGVCPTWNQKGMLYLQSVDDPAFLSLEVQRFDSIVDPGTSSGRVVVGRARIPFPEMFDRDVIGTYALVRSEGETRRPEGLVSVAMRLERIGYSIPCL